MCGLCPSFLGNHFLSTCFVSDMACSWGWGLRWIKVTQPLPHK